jgi:hypothetical protein
MPVNAHRACSFNRLTFFALSACRDRRGRFFGHSLNVLILLVKINGYNFQRKAAPTGWNDRPGKYRYLLKNNKKISNNQPGLPENFRQVRADVD